MPQLYAPFLRLTIFYKSCTERSARYIVWIPTKWIGVQVRGRYSQVNSGFWTWRSRLSTIMRGCLASYHNRHTYTDIKTHTHPDGQPYRRTDRKIHRDKQPDSRKTGRKADRHAGRKADRHAGRKTERQSKGQLDRQLWNICQYFTIHQLFRQARMQAVRLAESKAGRQEGRQAERWAVRQAGRQEWRIQTDRGTERLYVLIYIQTVPAVKFLGQ